MSPFKFEQKAVGIFLTAFYPNQADFAHHFMDLQHQSIDFIEIGIPYSDPIADGPIIQFTSEVAIQSGFTLSSLFEFLKTHKTEIRKPLVLMGYGNQVLQFGISRFLKCCREVGIKALIFPDLSPEMISRHPEFEENIDLPFVQLVTPSTSNLRIQCLAQACKSSFIYLVGSSQTTGGMYDLTTHIQRYKEIKQLCSDTPVFLGFGIDSSKKKEQAFEVVDGVIVGSAYLKAISEKREFEFLNELISC